MTRSFDSSIVICHGKSEYIFINNLKSNLRLKLIPYAKDNGNTSIQITSLNSILNNREFKSLRALSKKYDLNVLKGKIINFKVFIIMDFDEKEYDKEIKNNFLNKSMFKEHFLYEYIVPIYNINNFDDVMKKAGFKIDIKRKAKSYYEIFPGEVGNFEHFINVKAKIDNISTEYTNIHLVFEYLLDEYNKKNKY